MKLSGLMNDTLIVQQTKIISKNDFEIHDIHGRVVSKVVTGGSFLSRIFMGVRKLTLSDLQNTPQVIVRDRISLGRDKMWILDGNERILAVLKKRLTFFRLQVSVIMNDSRVEFRGNLWGLEYTILHNEEVWAKITRTWSGVYNAAVGKSTYYIIFNPLLQIQQRKVVLGSVLALDLYRDKRLQKSRSS